MTSALSTNIDIELPVIQAILDEDRDAFAEFVTRQSRWVRGVVYGVLGDVDRVEDVCQQVWSTVWQQKQSLQDPRSWRSWLYRMARNAAVDAGRETTRRRRLSKEFQQHVQHKQSSAGLDHSHEQGQLLLRAVNGLPALYREPFVLRHLEGWSYREISELLEIPVDTVETRLVRARRQLRESLKDRLM